MNSPSRLILLVGANPLPNFLAVCALRPSEVALIYTSETTAAKDRLKKELQRAPNNTVRFVEPDPFVEDATCATTVRRTIEPLLKRAEATTQGPIDASLNYTGGTKVMAAHARMAYAGSGGRPELASYLDEGGIKRQPRLRFDDGTSKPLSDYPDIPMTLTTVLALHGIRHEPRKTIQPAPTPEDAREILCRVLRDVPLAASLYCERERLEDKEYNNPSKATSAPFRANRYSLALSLAAFPTEDLLNGLANRSERESWFKQWYKFIGGEWLEDWVGSQIRQLKLQPEPEITVGINGYRGKKAASLEVDVVVIRGHRSYFISCTTDTTKRLCKSKIFEVAVRSRQLGGDLARAALVCLADDETVGNLQADIDDVWEANNTTKVFGLSDVRAWSDCEGKQPNWHALKAWMES